MCTRNINVVNEFISNPSKRNKAHVPDLGEFLIYLTISNVDWSVACSAIIKEVMIRNVKYVSIDESLITLNVYINLDGF